MCRSRKEDGKGEVPQPQEYVTKCPKSGRCLVPILDPGLPEGKSAITKARVWASLSTLTTDSPCSREAGVKAARFG
jgi:hypothetical protein